MLIATTDINHRNQEFLTFPESFEQDQEQDQEHCFLLLFEMCDRNWKS